MYYCCGITNQGIMSHNEDAFLIQKSVMTADGVSVRIPAPFLAAVSDGVSGEQSGELASELCLTLLSGVKFNRRLNLKRKLLEIHRQMAQLGQSNTETKNMQATLCGIGIDELDELHLYNVGDSRLYRYRNATIRQISTDQSLVQMLYQEGSITKEEKKTHIYRNIISPVMGNIAESPTPDVKNSKEQMQYGDILLLCTDGLSDYVTTAEMESILELPSPLPKRLQTLVDLALKKGGKDNVTMVAVVRY